MQTFEVGDSVNESGRKGKIVKIAKNRETIDVQFEDMSFPIRRQTRDLQMTRNNPRLKPVPSKIKETPRKNATKLYVFPKQKSFPIGDLFHARLALIYALSPTHRYAREDIIRAVEDTYPKYNWASWWDKKIKKLEHVESWDYYANYRMVANPRDDVVNPFTHRDELSTINNPKKRLRAEYDPSEAQFQSVVQGIYESIVRKRVGVPYNRSFKDKQGVRLDVKNFLDQDTMRELLSQAYAIATSKGQKHGTLHMGTQKATSKGIAKSKSRAKDKKHMEENIQDYEETLRLVRKNQSFRILKKKSRFYVMPHEEGFKSTGYKSESSAKSAITRYERKYLENPSSSREIQAARRAEIAQASSTRKPMRSRSTHTEWSSRVQIAALRNRLEKRGEKGKPRPLTPEDINLRGRKGSDDLSRMPIAVTVVQKYIYLPQMTSKGVPYLMYRFAPISSYYTIDLVGPSRKFNTYVDGAYVSLLNNYKWRAADYSGYKGQNLKIKDVREIIDKEGNVVGVKASRKSIGYSAMTYYPGKKLRIKNGFNTKALEIAKEEVIDAYRPWYKSHKKELDKKDPKLTFPTDVLKPEYTFIECEGSTYSVVDPIVNFGVFLRAFAELLLFMEDIQTLKSIEYLRSYFNTDELDIWIRENNLKQVIYNSMKKVGLERQAEMYFGELDKIKVDSSTQGLDEEDRDWFENQWKDIDELLVVLQGDSDKQGYMNSLKRKSQAKFKTLLEKFSEGDDTTPIMAAIEEDVKKAKEELDEMMADLSLQKQRSMSIPDGGIPYKRVLFSGSRNWDLEDPVKELVAMLPDDAVVVHGGATGLDSMVGILAAQRGLKVEVYEADWSHQGKRAGPLRNQEMVDAGADIVFAFPVKGGKGTQDLIKRAKNAGIPVKVYGVDFTSTTSTTQTTSSQNIPIVLKVDLFTVQDKVDAIGFTSNGIVKKDGTLVMGAGIAKAIKDRYPKSPEKFGKKVKAKGNNVYAFKFDKKNIFSFPTKDNYRQKSKIDLIAKSANELMSLIESKGWEKVALTFPGIGYGKLSAEEVWQTISPILDERVVLVYQGENNFLDSIARTTQKTNPRRRRK